MERQEQRNPSPVIALIGALLLISGIAGVIRDPVWLWQMSVYMRHPTALFTFISSLGGEPPYWWSFVTMGLQLLLAGASLLCGVVLLRHLPWARRATIFVLCGLIAVGLLDRLVSIATSTDISLLLHGVALPISLMHILLALFYALLAVGRNAVMLLFVASPRTREAFGEQPAAQPGRLQQVAQRLLGYLPKDLSPVGSLIALLLIFEALPMVFHLGGPLKNIHLLSAQHAGSLAVLTQVFAVIYLLGALAAGVCLLGRVRGAVYFTLAVLLIGVSVDPLALAPLLHGPVTLYFSLDVIISIIAAGVNILTISAKYVVLAVFLVRYREVSHQG
jgi:hypothetical protein